MNTYLSFAIATLVSVWLLAAALLAIGLEIRRVRRDHASTAAYRARLAERSDRSTEDLLWFVYRKQDAGLAEELEERRDRRNAITLVTERIEEGNARLAEVVGLHLHSVKVGS